MANKERGEFRLVVSDEEAYTLRLTTNACCELEDFAGRTWDQVMTGAVHGSIKSIRLLLWAALREHHPQLATEDQKSLREIGKLVDRMGGLGALQKQIDALVALNADPGTTDDEEEQQQPPKKGESRGRPRDAQAGTGGGSTATPSSSA